MELNDSLAVVLDISICSLGDMLFTLMPTPICHNESKVIELA
jgi:hypothetical protein